MTIAKLIKWGNSVGIRIPTQDLKKAHATVGQSFEITPNPKGGFILTPIKNPQAGWLEAFNAAAVSQPQIPSESIENEFDQDEWTW